MAAKLVITDGQSIGETVSLDDHVIFEIGRGDEAHLKLNDPEIDEIHLKVFREGEGYHVFDLSGRGFLINGARQIKHALTNNDTISIGSHTLRFEEISDLPTSEYPLSLDPPAPPSDPDFSSRADIAEPSETPAEPRYELHVIKGNDTGKVYNLKERPMNILGRGIATDITVWDIRCSRVHCRIDDKDDQFILSDMNSSNGTYINGVRTRNPVTLKPGDTIKIGSTVLQFNQI